MICIHLKSNNFAVQYKAKLDLCGHDSINMNT